MAATEKQQPMGHTAVEMGPKGPDGLATARLTIVVANGCNHNRVSKITPEVFFMDLGTPRKGASKGSRSNIELLGFVAFILEIEEDQVKLESGEKQNGKVVAVSGLKLEKKEIIWRFENQVGKRHEAHFAVDSINAARRDNNKQAQQRKKELDEFASARDEVLFAKAAPMSNLLLGAAAPKKSLPGALKRGAPGQAGDPAAKRPATEGGEPSAEEVAAPSADAQQAAEAPSADGVPSTGTAPEPAMGGLAAYDSEDESDDEDEKPALPKPEI